MCRKCTARVRLVRALVLREARVAIDAKHRAAVRPRVGDEAVRDAGEPRVHGRDERRHRLDDALLVAVLVGAETSRAGCCVFRSLRNAKRSGGKPLNCSPIRTPHRIRASPRRRRSARSAIDRRRAVVLLERLGALEVEVQVELPGEADAAVHLDAVARDRAGRLAGVGLRCRDASRASDVACASDQAAR